MHTVWIRVSAVLALCLVAAQQGNCQTIAAKTQNNSTPTRVGPTDLYGDPLPPGAVARFGSIRLRHILGHGSGASCVAFSPDGKTLISGGDTGLRAWDVATAKQLDWPTVAFQANVAFFTGDGKKLITADNEGAVRHLDASTGKLLLTRAPPKDVTFRGSRAAFISAGGDVLGTRDYSGTICLWRADTGAKILETKMIKRSLYSSCALSPDGKILVASGEDHCANLIDAANGNHIREIEGPNPASDLKPGFLQMEIEAIFGFVFSPDGTTLAGTGNHSICTWNVKTGNLLYEIKGSHGSLAFSPDGKYLACGGHHPVRLFDAATSQQVREFEPHAGWAGPLAFSQDGKMLAGGHGCIVKLWDVETGKHRHVFPGHETPVSRLAFSPDGGALASGEGEQGNVIVWDLATHKPRHTCRGHLGVLSLAYSPDGKILAVGDGDGRQNTGGMDAQIRLWNTAEGKLLRHWSGHLNSVQSLAFSPDGATLASAGHDARAKIWHVETGKRILQIRGADSFLKMIAFAPDGKTVALAGNLDGLALWKVDSGQKLRDIGTAGRSVADVTFLSDDKTILSMEPDDPKGGTRSWTIQLWDCESGLPLRSFPISNVRPYEPVFALSPDGRTFAAVAGDYRRPEIHLWDILSGQPLGKFDGHGGSDMAALAFSPNGKTLASGARDTTVLLWNVTRSTLFWSQLTSGNDEAARSLKEQAASPQEAIPILKEKLERSAAFELRVHELLCDLNHDRYDVREIAQRELTKLGPDVVPVLRKEAAKLSASEQERRRIDAIVKAQRGGKENPDFDQRRIGLSLAILEELATTDARQALQGLAKGAPASQVADAARVALQRMTKDTK